MIHIGAQKGKGALVLSCDTYWGSEREGCPSTLPFWSDWRVTLQSVTRYIIICTVFSSGGGDGRSAEC